MVCEGSSAYNGWTARRAKGRGDVISRENLCLEVLHRWTFPVVLVPNLHDQARRGRLNHRVGLGSWQAPETFQTTPRWKFGPSTQQR